jgi:hypothetical protein
MSDKTFLEILSFNIEALQSLRFCIVEIQLSVEGDKKFREQLKEASGIEASSIISYKGIPLRLSHAFTDHLFRFIVY